MFGAAGFTLAGAGRRGARWFLLGGGVLYLALAGYGAVIDHHSTANFVPVNTADNWLHFGLGAAMVALGVLVPAKHAARPGHPSADRPVVSQAATGDAADQRGQHAADDQP